MFEDAVNFLKKDKDLANVITAVGEIDFHWSDGDYFYILVQSIVHQQLAGSAARSIFNRLITLCKKITPENILNQDFNDLRSVGLSSKKIEYIQDLANKFSSFPDFSELPNDEIIDLLTSVKGIGRWTVEMFLIFSLKREDIFSYGDLGLRKAVQKLYALESLPNKKDLDVITTKWKPYRTIAALYLWKWLD